MSAQPPTAQGLLACVGSVLLLAGCVTTAPQVTSGWFQHASLMQARAGLDLFYWDPAFRPQEYDALLVAKPELPSPRPRHFYLRHLDEEFQQRLREHVQVLRLVPQVTTDPAEVAAHARVLVLDTQFTELTHGDQVQRWWFGEFGAGNTFIELRGRLIDPAMGTSFVEFADRRRGAAVLDIMGGDSEQLIREDLRGILDDLTQTLRAAHHETTGGVTP